MKRRIMFGMTIIFLLMTMVAFNTTSTSAKSGVKYKLSKNGTMTISGKGKMPKSMKFRDSRKIKKVIIKKGVKSISWFAFAYCKNLKSVKIENGVKEIGEFAFCGTPIKSITIPKSVKIIGCSAFDACNQLESLTIPGNFKYYYTPFDDEMEDIEDATDCVASGKKLTNVKFNTALNPYICRYLGGSNWEVQGSDPKYKSIDGIVYTKDGSKVIRVPSDRKEAKLDSNCKIFMTDAIFYGYHEDEGEVDLAACEDLKKIDLNNAAKIEVNWDYRDMENVTLEEMLIPENIDTDSLADIVTYMENIDGSNSENSDYDDTIKLKVGGVDYKNTKRIKEENGLRIVDDKVVISYEKDREEKDSTLKIPEKITRINAYSFKNSKNKKVILPAGIKEIGPCAFKSSNVCDINFPEGLKKIGKRCFYDSQIKEIAISDSVTTVGESAFEDCSLSKATLPDNWIKIPKRMFYHNYNLRSVNVPSGLKEIGEAAFASTNVDVQAFLNNRNLKSIDEDAFAYVKWKSLKIPSYIKVGKNALFWDSKKEARSVTFTGKKVPTSNVYAFGESSKKLVMKFGGGIKSSFSKIVLTHVGYPTKKGCKAKFWWCKTEGASGYTVMLSTDKKFKKDVHKLNFKKNKSQGEGYVKKDQTVYIKIRPYKLVKGKKKYGRWTKYKEQYEYLW